MKPTVLFLFNHSTYALQPWIDDGRFNVVTVDYSDTDHSAFHATEDRFGQAFVRLNVDLSQPDAFKRVNTLLQYGLGFALPSLVVSFAPCTDLAVSGAAHFERKRLRDPEFQNKAVAQARLAEAWGVPYAVENPVSVLSTLWRKPNHTFHPYEYAGFCDEGPHPEFPDVIPEQDRYNKKTCLWTGNGFEMPSKHPLAPLQQENPGFLKLGGKSARTKYIRSLTPRGFAYAMYSMNCRTVLNLHKETEPCL